MVTDTQWSTVPNFRRQPRPKLPSVTPRGHIHRKRCLPRTTSSTTPTHTCIANAALYRRFSAVTHQYEALHHRDICRFGRGFRHSERSRTRTRYTHRVSTVLLRQFTSSLLPIPSPLVLTQTQRISRRGPRRNRHQNRKRRQDVQALFTHRRTNLDSVRSETKSQRYRLSHRSGAAVVRESALQAGGSV